MAIIIQSLTPTSPSTPSGSGITFSVSAYDDSDPELLLGYEWQLSTDGISYSSVGLSNNTSSTFDTGPLTVNQNGLYVRVAVSNGSATLYSNQYPGIGERIILVFEDPSIIPLVDPSIDFYPPTITKQVGQNVEIVATASLANADITTTTLVNNINFQWQYSTDSGNNWIALTTGGDISISNVTESFAGITPTSYYKKSTLLIQNVTFDINLYEYRAVISYNGATNSPQTLSSVVVFIDPQINIYQQPGTGINDTIQTNCYKTSIPGSGRVTVQVGALSTANTQLNFNWQVDFGDGTWYDVSDVAGTNSSVYAFRLLPGTSFNTDLLQLDRFVYFDNVGFRCDITGVSGESSVTSNEHRILMTDIQENVQLFDTTYDIVEDRYGDIPDRDIYPDLKATAIIDATIDISRNNGLNGNRRFIWEKKNPGSSIWYEVGDEIISTTDNGIISYTPTPTDDENLLEFSYRTAPLRVDTDNGSKYRLKVESTAIYTLSGNPQVKTITPYYSDEITLNVYRTVYITNQPGNAIAFPNSSASFSVTAIPSSGSSSDITYQWQYNRSGTDTWINVPSSSPYSGTQTDLLIISPVPSTLTYNRFRCIVSIAGQLSSTTSTRATLTVRNDIFTFISSLNDISAREFDNISFSISAQTLSAGAVSYQWQKSLDYRTSTSTGNWTDIIGEQSDTLNLLSVDTSDEAFYRVKLTSFGGTVAYSNVAYLGIEEVNVSVTQNIVTSIEVLEGQAESYIFECEGFSSIGTEVSYQWQIRRSGDSSFSNIGPGFNNSLDTNKRYVLRALDTITDNNAIIRCRISADEVPNPAYTNQCVVSVIRRFTYFADVSNKQVTLGSTLTLDLNPTITGGSPSYMWQENGVDMNETQEVLIIPNIDSSYNGKTYRCRVTLDACTQHQYSRNNVVTTSIVTPPSAFTVSITITTVSTPSEPIYYSNETAKTGAAIGTVICIPKPAGYVEDASANDDDIQFWGCARSGTVTPETVTRSSVRTSSNPSTAVDGNVWSINKPSWANSDYRSPKWILSRDRFKGYIELRGQWLLAAEFPELARQYGNKFGGNITRTYPNYIETEYFRLPNTYAKRLMGTGNVNNNSGSVSVIPLYDPNGLSGGDKNVPGSMGGVYNYERSAQLPPGSPGLSGEPDGTADGLTNASTFSVGSFRSEGFEDVNAFAQPSFAGTVTYSIGPPVNTFTQVPVHSHTAVSAGFRETSLFSDSGCARDSPMVGGNFVGTQGDFGQLEPPTPCVGESHGHEIERGGSGTFDMVVDGGMFISDTTLRLTAASRSIFDNNMVFYLRNNESIPLNAPYYRLKYLIKAY